jgi:hypothetical protein
MSEPNKTPGGRTPDWTKPDPWEGMTYEEVLANPPTGLRKKRPPLPQPKPQRKAVLAEVSPRMHAAVKANPEKLRLIAEDANGNAVVDRPYRRTREEQPISPDGPHTSAVGAIKWGRSGFPGPVWDSGGGRGDELVKRNYDIYAVLREDD